MVSLNYFFNVGMKSVSHRYNERVVSAGFEEVFGFWCMVFSKNIDYQLFAKNQTLFYGLECDSISFKFGHSANISLTDMYVLRNFSSTHFSVNSAFF